MSFMEFVVNCEYVTGTEAIKHKTFHSYTVRAKQGGSQSSKDNSGRHAKSAGASLRRYNEQSLTQVTTRGVGALWGFWQ